MGRAVRAPTRYVRNVIFSQQLQTRRRFESRTQYLMHLREMFRRNSSKFRRTEAITLAALPKALIILAGSNTVSVGSNPIRDMDVCLSFILCLCSVFLAALRRAKPTQEITATVCTIYNVRNNSEMEQA
jgi:uncharacterized membrane protein YbaN (DUF454 family)